jgi:hypothetical protein
MSVVVVVISQHLLNVFVQLANKRGLKKKLHYTDHLAVYYMNFLYILFIFWSNQRRKTVVLYLLLLWV